jgi:hypothetical protein
MFFLLRFEHLRVHFQVSRPCTVNVRRVLPIPMYNLDAHNTTSNKVNREQFQYRER